MRRASESLGQRGFSKNATRVGETWLPLDHYRPLCLRRRDPLVLALRREAFLRGFCGTMFVVGSGLGTLETAANPFIAVCGEPKWSELPLNLL